MSLERGKVLGAYEILDPIGAGGMERSTKRKTPVSAEPSPSK